MSKNFNADNVTEFLDKSVGSFLNEIEDLAIEMCQADHPEDRLALLTDIQEIIWKCNAVLK